MDSIIDGEPARDDRGSLAAQQRVDVDVDLPYGVISTVSVMVQNRDLQGLILQVLILDLEGKRNKEAKVNQRYTHLGDNVKLVLF